MVKKIKKRDGSTVTFDQEKITLAVSLAIKAIARQENIEPDLTIAQRISDRVAGVVETTFAHTIPTVEQIQDLVEVQLIKDGYATIAKHYILYREKHKNIRQSRSTLVDSVRLIKNYVNEDDWKVKEDSNCGKITFAGLNKHISGEMFKTFALNQMYSEEVADAHISGKIHIHDLAFPIVGYCAGWSMQNLLLKGYGEIPGRIQSNPPKHLDSVCNQMANFIITMTQEFAGAQAFSSVDTFLAPFVKVDRLTQKQIEQSLQMLIFNLNAPVRWGFQAPFSNLTFDLVVPDDLKNRRTIVGGIEQDFTYEDCQAEMDMINIAFLNVLKKGDKNGRIFTFPIPTYNLTKDFDWDSPIANTLFEITGKYGYPYFQNYIGSDIDPKSIRAMCCRLNLDQRELMNRPGSMWGPGDSTGSIGVVTINLNRIGYLASNEAEFFKLLNEAMEVASVSLETKRKMINSMLKIGLMPYTKIALGTFNNHFSTIGICGMNEAIMNFMNKTIDSREGIEFTIRVMNFMRDTLKRFQNETKNLYNLEATPAESTSHRFSRLDKKLYPNIITAGNKVPFLTNSTHLPVNGDRDLVKALKHQDQIQPLYTGGTIFHTFLPEKISMENAKKLVRYIAENTKLPYFSITPEFSICPKHNYFPGRQEKCPECHGPVEVWSRIVGYFRPVEDWNCGKQEEFKLRNNFDSIDHSENKTSCNETLTKGVPKAKL